MRFFITVSACVLYLGVTDCGSGPTESNGQMLQGRWGTADEGNALLIADRTAAVLYLGCARISVSQSIQLTPDGRFAFQGNYDRDGPGPALIRHLADVTGQIQGNTVVLMYDVRDDDQGGQSVSLQRGVEPSILFPCPLQNMAL